MVQNEIYNKFTVIKNEDIKEYLTPTESDILNEILTKIEVERADRGKNQNKYLVINQDESYAELIKKFILREVKMDEIERTNLNLKIFQFDDGETHWIVAKNKEDAINWYEGEYVDEDILKDGYNVAELPRDTKMEIYVAEDINLINTINKYRNQKEKTEHINVWLYLSYWIIEESLRGNKFETPVLIASSVY